MRSLGQFVGHVWHAVKTPADEQRERHELRREVEQQTREADGGKLTVRRTTIEEVEFERESGSSHGP